MLFLSCVCHAFASVHCCLVATCWERADLLALVCGLKLCSYYFPMWYPGPGVVIGCIDSSSLPLSYFNKAESAVSNILGFIFF